MDTYSSVSLAAIGLALTTVGGLVWVVKYFAKQLSTDLQEHTKAAVQQVAESKEARAASKEVLIFMKGLNGRLAKITAQTIQEQTVEHQKVKEAELEKAVIKDVKQ